MPSHAEFSAILDRTGGLEPPAIEPVASGQDILDMERTLRAVPIDGAIQDHLIRVVTLHPPDHRHGAAGGAAFRPPRRSRRAPAILAASRGRALLAGRFHVAREDVNAVALPALRHRIIL